MTWPVIEGSSPWLNEPARIVVTESLELARKNDEPETIAFMENALRILNCEAADITCGEFIGKHGAECSRPSDSESDFLPWLLSQRNRDDAIQDLADDLACRFRISAGTGEAIPRGIAELRNHLCRHLAPPEAFEALEKAKVEYEKWLEVRARNSVKKP